ncbi:MAG: hypothetical protein ACREJD_01610 [Phycisphaerales bacterium]
MLEIAKTRFRVAGKDAEGRALRPVVLSVIPICDSERRIAALQVWGGASEEGQSGGNIWPNQIDVMAVYSPALHEFVLLGKNAQAIRKPVAEPSPSALFGRNDR